MGRDTRPGLCSSLSLLACDLLHDARASLRTLFRSTQSCRLSVPVALGRVPSDLWSALSPTKEKKNSSLPNPSLPLSFCPPPCSAQELLSSSQAHWLSSQADRAASSFRSAVCLWSLRLCYYSLLCQLCESFTVFLPQLGDPSPTF